MAAIQDRLSTRVDPIKTRFARSEPIQPVLCSNPNSTVARLVNRVNVIVREVRIGGVKSVELRLRTLRETRARSYPIATIRGLIKTNDPIAGEASECVSVVLECSTPVFGKHQPILGAEPDARVVAEHSGNQIRWQVVVIRTLGGAA